MVLSIETDFCPYKVAWQPPNFTLKSKYQVHFQIFLVIYHFYEPSMLSGSFLAFWRPIWNVLFVVHTGFKCGR